MTKYEKEIKILNINVKEAKNKLLEINAEYKGTKNQKLYTYDIPTIYYRYLEIMELLKSSNELLVVTSIKKLGVLLEEFEDLVEEDKINLILKEMNVLSFKELLQKDPKVIKKTFKLSKVFNKEISNHLINPNKWIRLRRSNDKVELTVKHIFNKSNESIQKVKEYETNVSNLDETNSILEAIGLSKRNYQEKIRHSYIYKIAEIEIDEWPNLEPYMEIECDDEKLIKELIDKLNYSSKEIVSLNTEQLYKRKNIDILKMPDLKFK